MSAFQSWFSSSRKTRLGVAWLVCLVFVGDRLRASYGMFGPDPGTPKERIRADGNDGHTRIDFGGQWMMGRMIATGHGRELFNRTRHWEILRSAYPRTAEAPFTQAMAFPESVRPASLKDTDARHDVEELMAAMMGKDSPRWKDLSLAVGLPLAGASPWDSTSLVLVAQSQASPELIAELEKPVIGGPLYPPFHSVLYSPFGLLTPQSAYRVLQIMCVALTLVSGGFVSILTANRVWTPIATIFILLFPGCREGIDLGQNNMIALTIVLGGWTLAARNRPHAGGAVWGLLAFKPVWGLAFAVVPLLMGRWRFLLGLAVSGCSLVLLTLPIVGVQAWLDWLTVGKLAATMYDVNENWIELSRDLSGLVRRLVLDFHLPESERASALADRLSWILWATVLLSTAVVYRRRHFCREAEGFLFLGAVLTGYRFMYYDQALAFVAFVAIARHWPLGSLQARLTSFPSVMFAILLLVGNWWRRLDIALEIPIGGRTFSLASDFYHPVDTLLLLGLWGGLALRLYRQPRSSSSADPISADRMSDSPTNTA